MSFKEKAVKKSLQKTVKRKNWKHIVIDLNKKIPLVVIPSDDEGQGDDYERYSKRKFSCSDS